MRMLPFLAATAITGMLAVSHTAVAQESRSGAPASAANDPAGGSASVLLTRQGQRLDLLETDLRDMRGVLELSLIHI